MTLEFLENPDYTPWRISTPVIKWATSFQKKISTGQFQYNIVKAAFQPKLFIGVARLFRQVVLDKKF